MITNKEILTGIRKDLGLDAEITAESYAALPKQYDINTDFLSKKAKTAHTSLYQAHTQELSKISAELDTVDKKKDTRKYQELKTSEIFHLNAVYLHELYFANVGDQYSEISMNMLSFMRISRDFGTFDDWQFDFIAAAQSNKNGWAVCAYSTFLRRYINFFVDGNSNSIPVGCYPVVVIDMWEHAYFRDYLTDKKPYILSMMKELNWKIIDERFKRAEKIAEALR